MILDSSHSGRQDWRRERLGTSVRGRGLRHGDQPGSAPCSSPPRRPPSPTWPAPSGPVGGWSRCVCRTRPRSKGQPEPSAPPQPTSDYRTSAPAHALCRSGRRRDGREGLARAGPPLIRDQGNPATLKADGGASVKSVSSRCQTYPWPLTGPSGRRSPTTVTIRMNPGSRTRTRPSSPALRRLMSLVHAYGDEDA